MQSEFIRELGRIITGAYYDYQEVRRAMMGRLRALIRRKVEGIPLGQPDERRKKRATIKSMLMKICHCLYWR